MAPLLWLKMSPSPLGCLWWRLHKNASEDKGQGVGGGTPFSVFPEVKCEVPGGRGLHGGGSDLGAGVWPKSKESCAIDQNKQQRGETVFSASDNQCRKLINTAFR